MIVITGTPRSGTSLTAEFLHRLGFDLGTPGDLDLARSHENRRGKWESRTAVRINKELFSRYRDNERMLMPWEVDLDPRIAAEIRNFPAAVVKDPRFSYTLGIWIQAGKMVEHVIWCWRHPAAVLRSFASIHPGHRFLERGPIDHAGHLAHWLMIHQVPHTVVRFPGSARDPSVFGFLRELRPELTPEDIRRAHRDISDPDLLRFG